MPKTRPSSDRSSRPQSLPVAETIIPQAADRAGRVIFWACLVFLAVFIVGDCYLRHVSHAELTALQTNEVAAESIPVSQGARIRSVILPATAMDTRWWVIHAEQFLRGEEWRIRHTSLDNAPQGREVHWHSGLIWAIAGMSGIIATFSGGAAVDFVPAAAFWVVPVSLVACLALLGSLAVRRFGFGPTGVFLLIFTTSTLVYQCFRAGEADHHGIVCTLAVASVLSLAAGGAGNVQPSRRNGSSGFGQPLSLEAARRWFRLSGFLGGAALWVSAASFIPILAGCGMGAVAAFLLRDRSASVAEPQLWRAWSRTGCLASLGFYVLEYFPHHLGWRLEVNHPIYAFAWLGAGEVLARVLERMQGRPLVERKGAASLVASLVALLVPAGLIVSRPDQFFWVSDRFLLLLHNQFIQEFQRFSSTLADRPLPTALAEMFAWPLFTLLGTGYLAFRGQLRAGWRPLLAVVILPALVMHALAMAQIRWSILSMGLWTLCAMVLLAAYLDRPGRRSLVFLTLFAVALISASLTFPVFSLISVANIRLLKMNLPKSVIPTVLLRDVAHRLVQSSPARLPVVLAGPTSSTELTYYGGIPTIGTLYWENRDGLKTAARIFAASTDEEAKKRLRDAGITHIVAATWDNFGQAYVELLRQAGEPVAAADQLFVRRLQPGQETPDWLRPLYYPIPPLFGIEKEKLLIFQFVEGQSHIEALYHRAAFAFDGGDFAQAEKLFAEALLLNPASPVIRQSLEAARDRLKKSPPIQPPPHEKPTPL